MQTFPTLLCLVISACELAFGQTFAMESVEDMRANKVVAEAVVHKGQKGIRLTQPAGATGKDDDRLLLLPVKDFESGTIEVDPRANGSGWREGAFVRAWERAADAGGERFEAGRVPGANRLLDRAWDHWTFSKRKGD